MQIGGIRENRKILYWSLQSTILRAFCEMGYDGNSEVKFLKPVPRRISMEFGILLLETA